MPKLYDTVRLKKDNEELGVKASYLGTIVDVLNGGEAYTIEFVDENGDSIEAALFAEFKPDEFDVVESI